MSPRGVVTLLFLARGLVFGQTPSPPPQLPTNVVFVTGGYGTKVDGTLGYGQLISQASGVYNLSYFRFVPQGAGKLEIPAVTTGVAPHLRDVWWIHAYALAQGGAATTTSATLFTGAIGGFVTINPPGWKRVSGLVGVDMDKTAGGKSYPNFSLGVVIKP